MKGLDTCCYDLLGSLEYLDNKTTQKQQSQHFDHCSNHNQAGDMGEKDLSKILKLWFTVVYISSRISFSDYIAASL